MKIISTYQPEELMSATPSRLVVMLYDEAIGALRTAAVAARKGEIERRCNATVAATEIIGYLYMNLDVVNGGEVADNLAAIYAHIMRRLPRINLHNDAEIADEAVQLLRPLRQSWAELDRLVVSSDDVEGDDDREPTSPAVIVPMKGRRPTA